MTSNPALRKAPARPGHVHRGGHQKNSPDAAGRGARSLLARLYMSQCISGSCEGLGSILVRSASSFRVRSWLGPGPVGAKPSKGSSPTPPLPTRPLPPRPVEPSAELRFVLFPPACLIGRYPPSRPLLSPDVFPQRVLLVFRRLVLPFFDNAHLAQPHSAPSTLLPAFARQALQPVPAPLADFQLLANDHCTILRSFSMRASRVSRSANLANRSECCARISARSSANSARISARSNSFRSLIRTSTWRFWTKTPSITTIRVATGPMAMAIN